MGSIARVAAGGERLDVAVRGANDGLWDWDLTTDTLYCSPRWHSIAGIRDGGDVVPPSFWLDRVHPDDLPELRAAIDAHLRSHVDHLACETRLRGDDGAYRWTLVRGLALRREDGTPYRLAGSLTDTTDRRHAEERRLHEASHDALTGLANRALFLDRLSLAIRRRHRTETHRVAVVLMDVDRFKVVNDSLGHALGDDLLIAVARRLEGCLREEDTVARLGGDEWAILIDGLATDDEASRVAERVRQSLQQPLVVGGHSLFVTVSAGIALLTDALQAPEDLLRDAETAMYRAKELGRDRHVVFDPSLHGRAVALLALESDLRFALERGELVVYYQPIVTADGLTVRGVEALVRWRHPERGLVSPADFIGFAEESGLILPLGEWVLGRAIEQMREWQAAGVAPARISVNLSARQLHQENLAERVAFFLDRAGLEPGCLELELTEGVVAEQAESTIDMLKRLRALGIQLAVDDFGTGYSSLAYLTRFPVSTVKIDRAFLIDIQHDLVNQAIVQAVTTLAHSIGMRVVAEGIETTEQLDLARSLGCDEAQGYLISRPISTDEATVWLDEQYRRELWRRMTPAS
jgi:diguanylate cyclase (GGDEF)-like protein